MNEFELIHTYLSRHADKLDDECLLGVGDDAAILRPNADADIHISSDMLVGGRHFFTDVRPEDLAHKILAVNLSDMAAMGATPRWALLSAGLPQLDKTWLDAFCNAFFTLADAHQVRLIGGDTTRADWVFNLTIIGQTPRGRALRRDAAQVGDDIWVSGRLGLAAAALDDQWLKVRLPETTFTTCEAQRLRPQARVRLGEALRDIAHAAQDISDGLLQDLNHILHASSCAADIWLEHIPSLPDLQEFAEYHQWILAGGDDYELLFTAPPEQREAVLQAAQASQTPISRIGIVRKGTACRVLTADGSEYLETHQGFDHFA